MKNSITIIVVFSLLVMLGCTQPVQEEAVDYSADKEVLTKLFQENGDAVLAGDMNGTMAIYHDESIRTHNVQVRLEGKEAIQKFYEDWMEKNTFTDFNQDIEDIMVDGDLAVVINKFTGTAAPKDSSESYTMSMRALGVFKRQEDGTWKNVYTMLN